MRDSSSTALSWTTAGEQSSVNNDISNKGVNTIAGVFLAVVFMSAAVSNSEFDNKKNLV